MYLVASVCLRLTRVSIVTGSVEVCSPVVCLWASYCWVLVMSVIGMLWMVVIHLARLLACLTFTHVMCKGKIVLSRMQR